MSRRKPRVEKNEQYWIEKAERFALPIRQAVAQALEHANDDPDKFAAVVDALCTGLAATLACSRGDYGDLIEGVTQRIYEQTAFFANIENEERQKL